VRREESIWITGVGAATPLGMFLPTIAGALLNGRSGVSLVDEPSWDRHSYRLVARVGPIPVPGGWEEAEFRRLERLEQLFVWCGAQALAESGLRVHLRPERVGLILGLGAEALRHWELTEASGGPPRPVAHCVRDRLGLRGPATVVAAACASGNVALAQACVWLRLGWVDAVLAGAADLFLTPLALACFRNMRVLSCRQDSPAAASRPFDRDRDGFVPGEGGALFVLEMARVARRRSVHPYAELAGVGLTCDAAHLVSPGADPGPAMRAFVTALAEGGVSPEQVDYINAHAPGTLLGDRFEARVLRLALGTAADRVPVSSTKSVTGHLLSGAAAMEALACLIALQRQAVPPTVNLDAPDPECDLLHVPHRARAQPVRVAVSNSFGFGGCNTTAVFRRVSALTQQRSA
jgi:3-oxoacyl-[acyl-carrier-protein] synthase II